MASYGSLWPGEASETVIPTATSTIVIQRNTRPRRSMTV